LLAARVLVAAEAALARSHAYRIHKHGAAGCLCGHGHAYHKKRGERHQRKEHGGGVGSEVS
jgi:hypothetical protein